MSSSALHDLIYDWLARRHPDGPEWNKSGFHCFRDCHPIIRQLAAMDAVEGEISNGAWGQLLWNTYPNWRTVLELAADGYASMGAIAQVQAIPQLRAKLAEYEQACHEAMQRAAKGDFESEFSNFSSIGYADTSFKPQMAFLDEQLVAARDAWLEKNRESLLQAMSA